MLQSTTTAQKPADSNSEVRQQQSQKTQSHSAPGLDLLLRDLKQAQIVVDGGDKIAQENGLTDNVIRTTVTYNLQTEIRTVKFTPAAESIIYFRLRAYEPWPHTIFLDVDLQVFRPVRVFDNWSDSTIATGLASVWQRSGASSGPKADVPSEVSRLINEYVTQLATDYRRQNLDLGTNR